MIERAAGEQMRAAWSCRTWRDSARLCRMSWTAMVTAHGDEVSEIQGHEDPRADEPFTFGSIWGVYGVGSRIRDPRAVARNLLGPLLPLALEREPKLYELIEWNGGSPGGHIGVVSLASRRTATLLQSALRADGHACVFSRDDSYLRTVFGQGATTRRHRSR